MRRLQELTHGVLQRVRPSLALPRGAAGHSRWGNMPLGLPTRWSKNQRRSHTEQDGGGAAAQGVAVQGPLVLRDMGQALQLPWAVGGNLS